MTANASLTTTVILNPRASAGKSVKRWQGCRKALEKRFGDVEVVETTGPGDATRLCREALQNGAERIVAVGGDGSINEVVNGFFENGKPLYPQAELVVVPAGTGSDFARSIGLASGLDIDASYIKDIDVGWATIRGHSGEDIERYFINISSFGSSGLIVDMVNKSPKVLGGKFSFMLGTLRGLASYRNQRIRLQVGENFDEELLVNTVAVANGRYFGGAMMIAPDATLDDGMFDVVVIGDISVATFIRHSGKLYRGEHLSLPKFRHIRGSEVIATPIDGAELLIDLDGEQPGKLPVHYRVIPAALKVFAPWDQAEACGAATG